MYEKELQIALQAAKAAAEIIQKYYNTNYEVHHKSAEQPVTVADREANDAIQKILLGAFPNDGWLSEETTDNPSRLGRERVWIVDPLDGTKEFIAKVPEFAVSIGLAHRGEVVVGVVANPATNETLWAAKGSGAFCNGAPITVSRQSEISKARMLASRSESNRGEWKRYEEEFIVIPSGSMAWKMAQVALGLADGSFSLSPKNEWDFAGGTIIVQEAGGTVCQLDGTPFTFNKASPLASGIVHDNGYLHEAIMGCVAKVLQK